MAQLTVRKLPDDLVVRLKVRAARNSRSAEAEHRAILEAVLADRQDEFWSHAAELRAATRGRVGTNSSELIRRDRQRDELPRRDR
jgi:plasmid stability protein